MGGTVKKRTYLSGYLVIFGRRIWPFRRTQNHTFNLVNYNTVIVQYTSLNLITISLLITHCHHLLANNQMTRTHSFHNGRADRLSKYHFANKQQYFKGFLKFYALLLNWKHATTGAKPNVYFSPDHKIALNDGTYSVSLILSQELRIDRAASTARITWLQWNEGFSCIRISITTATSQFLIHFWPWSW